MDPRREASLAVVHSRKLATVPATAARWGLGHPHTRLDQCSTQRATRRRSQRVGSSARGGPRRSGIASRFPGCEDHLGCCEEPMVALEEASMTAVRSSPDTVASLADRLEEHQIFGPPVQQGGTTLVPMAKVRAGGGVGCCLSDGQHARHRRHPRRDTQDRRSYRRLAGRTRLSVAHRPVVVRTSSALRPRTRPARRGAAPSGRAGTAPASHLQCAPCHAQVADGLGRLPAV